MRVSGNAAPNAVEVWSYPANPRMAEVRIRENVKAVVETDTQTQAEITMYEYDEYTFHVPDREGLQDDIESHLDEWIATGRTLEVNESASIVVDQRCHINAYEQALSEIETALGVT